MDENLEKIYFKCQICKEPLRGNKREIGSEITCPNCDRPNFVPARSTRQPPMELNAEESVIVLPPECVQESSALVKISNQRGRGTKKSQKAAPVTKDHAKKSVVGSIVIIAACTLYILSPIDILPEVILGPFGLIDDAGALFILIKTIRQTFFDVNE